MGATKQGRAPSVFPEKHSGIPSNREVNLAVENRRVC
jgi:hypothetical protein